MPDAPDSRVSKDNKPVVVTFPEFSARKLTMAESIVQVYNLAPKINGGLSLWELVKMPFAYDPDDDSWPFILAAIYPIIRVFPRPSNTASNVRYFVDWSTFEIIVSKMIDRDSAGIAFPPWDMQYRDILPPDEPDGEDQQHQVMEGGKSAQSHVRTPTEEEVLKGSFKDAIVDGVPLLELDQADAKPKDSEQKKGFDEEDSPDSPSDGISFTEEVYSVDQLPVAGAQSRANTTPETDKAAARGEKRRRKSLKATLACDICRSLNLLCLDCVKFRPITARFVEVGKDGTVVPHQNDGEREEQA
ncbi:MAG: hypothetical protein Q9168_004097 [Polycauliona sp. 1 TL-2023]